MVKLTLLGRSDRLSIWDRLFRKTLFSADRG